MITEVCGEVRLGPGKEQVRVGIGESDKPVLATRKRAIGVDLRGGSGR